MNDSSNNPRALLSGVSLFSELDAEALGVLLEHARSLSFRKNTVLMSEGEIGESMYVIRRGSVKIYVGDEQGHEIVLFIEGPGSYIGEISLLDGEPRTASAITLEPTEVLSISKTGFMACLREHPDIAFQIIRSMTHRLRRATGSIRSLALESVYQRLASKLIELAEAEDGVNRLPRRFSNQELAQMIGASREMVGKIMNDLTQGEYIEKQDRRWTLLRTLPEQW